MDDCQSTLLDKIGAKRKPYVTRRRKRRSRSSTDSKLLISNGRLAILQPPLTVHPALPGWWVTILNLEQISHAAAGSYGFDVSWVDGSLIS